MGFRERKEKAMCVRFWVAWENEGFAVVLAHRENKRKNLSASAIIVWHGLSRYPLTIFGCMDCCFPSFAESRFNPHDTIPHHISWNKKHVIHTHHSFCSSKNKFFSLVEFSRKKKFPEKRLVDEHRDSKLE